MAKELSILTKFSDKNFHFAKLTKLVGSGIFFSSDTKALSKNESGLSLQLPKKE